MEEDQVTFAEALLLLENHDLLEEALFIFETLDISGEEIISKWNPFFLTKNKDLAIQLLNFYGLTGEAKKIEDDLQLSWLSPKHLSAMWPSRYLSLQPKENPKSDPNDRAGFDPNFRMINIAKLDYVDANPPLGHPNNIPYVRPGARLLSRETSETLTSEELMNMFFRYLTDPSNKFQEVQKRISEFRKFNIAKNGRMPLVAISGLGPVGLLAALEAYAAGSSIVGVELRSQYVRSQILRLSKDSVRSFNTFTGDDVWLKARIDGIVSKSPNWTANEFDIDNEYIYDPLKKQKTLERWSFEKIAQREKLLSTYELEVIDIIRINHLETMLAAVLEMFAKNDPENIRLYYGSSLHANTELPNNGLNPSYRLTLKSRYQGQIQVCTLTSDILVIAEGADSELFKALNLRTILRSNKAYGVTAALRLPNGFDIGLRPIENYRGSASVKGIAIIDEQKLHTANHHNYSWTMIQERQLCEELNQVITETSSKILNAGGEFRARKHGQPPRLQFPCEGIPPHSKWQKVNGGQSSFLPRSRYFFTAGIAYMGVDLNRDLFELFNKKNEKNKEIKLAAKTGLKKFMLLMAKKHLPHEYIEGQNPKIDLSPKDSVSSVFPSVRAGFQYKISSVCTNGDVKKCDQEHLISLAEEKTSHRLFIIQLKSAANLWRVIRVNNDDNEEMQSRVVVLGDSYATTHFFTGSGVVNGVRMARSFGEALIAGARKQDFERAEHNIAQATSAMHDKVINGSGNAPLDGPFNQALTR